MPASPQEFDNLFNALGNAKRREIVRTLALHPSTVGKLAEEHGLSLPSIHRHIRDLESAGLLLRKKIGRTNFLAIRREGLREAQGWLGQFRADWGSDDETLENYIAHLQ